MRTFADVKRRLVPGARLICEAHKFPEMVGTVRTVVEGSTVLRCSLTGHPRIDGDDFRWELPKAHEVTIVDADAFEYPLVERRPGDATPIVRLRFLP